MRQYKSTEDAVYPLCPKCRHNTVAFGHVSIEGRTWGTRCPICAWEEVEFVQDAAGQTYRPLKALPPEPPRWGVRHRSTGKFLPKEEWGDE